jgi:hypothetical protein
MVLAEAPPPQFYIQLVYRDTFPFTLTSKNPSFSQFGIKKVYFASEIEKIFPANQLFSAVATKNRNYNF